MEKYFPRKWSPKANRSSHTYIWKSRVQAKISQKKQRRSLHIDKGNNPAWRDNNLSIYTLNDGTPSFIKQILLDIMQVDLNTKVVGNFNTPLSPIDRLSRQNNQ
jgi:hypothetical protein